VGREGDHYVGAVQGRENAATADRQSGLDCVQDEIPGAIGGLVDEVVRWGHGISSEFRRCKDWSVVYATIAVVNPPTPEVKPLIPRTSRVRLMRSISVSLMGYTWLQTDWYSNA